MTHVRIAVILDTNLVTMDELALAVAACQQQVDGELSRNWGASATLTAYADDPFDGSWRVYVVSVATERPDYRGFHRASGLDNLPSGKVAVAVARDAGVPWTRALSHEICEMLVDPYLDRTEPGPNGSWAREICDPVQDVHCSIGTVQVSAIVYPNYFNVEATDHFASPCAGITKPFEEGKGVPPNADGFALALDDPAHAWPRSPSSRWFRRRRLALHGAPLGATSAPADLRRKICDVPGVAIAAGTKDLSLLFADARAFQVARDGAVARIADRTVDLVLSLDDPTFGASIAAVLRAGHAGARLHPDDGSVLQVAEGLIRPQTSVLVVGDVLGDGRSAVAGAALVRRAGAKLVALVFIAELKRLGGRNLITDADDNAEVHALVVYAE